MFSGCSCRRTLQQEQPEQVVHEHEVQPQPSFILVIEGDELKIKLYCFVASMNRREGME